MLGTLTRLNMLSALYSWIHAARSCPLPKHALLTNTEQGNLQHTWTDKVTESVISGASQSFGWQLKIGNFKILTYAKPVPKAKL